MTIYWLKAHLFPNRPRTRRRTCSLNQRQYLLRKKKSEIIDKIIIAFILWIWLWLNSLEICIEIDFVNAHIEWPIPVVEGIVHTEFWSKIFLSNPISTGRILRMRLVIRTDANQLATVAQITIIWGQTQHSSHVINWRVENTAEHKINTKQPMKINT